MLDILDRLAVREAVRRQPRQRRRICRLLMAGCTRSEVAERLGIADMTVHAQIRRIRRSFVGLGFEDWRPCRRRRDASASLGMATQTEADSAHEVIPSEA